MIWTKKRLTGKECVISEMLKHKQGRKDRLKELYLLNSNIIMIIDFYKLSVPVCIQILNVNTWECHSINTVTTYEVAMK